MCAKFFVKKFLLLDISFEMYYYVLKYAQKRGNNMKQSESMSIEVYNLLKDKIISMELMPGQILIAQQLSAENNISRTPVREALIRLENIGFVESSTGGKYRVTNITWSFIVDLYNTRRILEKAAVSALIHTLTEKELSQLEDYNNLMDKSLKDNDLDRFFENDMNFHNFLLYAYGNQVIYDLCTRMAESQQRIRYITAGIEGRMQESIVEHQNIVYFLRRQNEAEAISVLDKHLISTVEDLRDLRNKQFTVPSRIIKW